MSVVAQTQTSTTGQFTTIVKDAPAPFNGVLFDYPAVALMLADKEVADKGFQLKLDFELDKLRSEMQLKIDSLQVDVRVLTNKNEAILEVKDTQIKETTEIAMQSNDLMWLWITLSFLGGVLVAGGSVYLAGQLK